MRIKQIAIIGFKSYKDQVFEEPLSPKHNVVVGKNGSGKSNFFNAIQFVLSEKYAQLQPTERRDLLHATAGTPVLSAYVEIIFDNSDGRLVIPGFAEQKEVSIRRTIGIQKDEFRVNDRAMSAYDVRQLLEGAGFSAANPYYVVEQGRIVRITNMSEADKLHLLKEVAGTKVYESRREESLRILEETKEKRDRINETFAKLEERKVEVEKETLELQELHKLEGTMRKIAFCLYSQDSEKLEKELRAKQVQEKPSPEIDALYEEKCKIESEVYSLEESLQRHVTRFELVEREKKKNEEAKLLLMNKRARNQARQSVAEREATSRGSARLKLEEEKAALRASLDQIRNDIESKTMRHRELQSQLESKTSQEAALEAKVLRLQSRRANSHLFKNPSARNKWLSDQINVNKQFCDAHEKELHELLHSEKEMTKDVESEKSQAETLSGAILRNESSIQDKDETEQLNAIKHRDELNLRRHTAFQKLYGAEQQLKEKRAGLDRAKQALDGATGSRDIREGLKSLDAALQDLKETDKALYDAVHGPVIELFECSAEFFTATEVTAGNALFNIVVDTFAAGSAILHWLNSHGKGGRLTFLPLDTCSGQTIDLAESDEMTPLIKHLKFDKKFTKVFQSIFGSTMLASSLEVATSVSSSMNCSAVTLDGDQVNRKGGLRGGFIQRASRLALHAQVKTYKESVRCEYDKYQVVRQEIADIEQDIINTKMTIDEIQGKASTIRTDILSARRDLHIKNERIENLYRSLARIQEAISTAKGGLTKASENVRVFTAEKAEPFKSTFDTKDESELEKTIAVLADVRTHISKLGAKTSAESVNLQLLRDTLGTDTKRLDLISGQLCEWVGSSPSVESERCIIENVALEKEISDLSKTIRSSDEELAIHLKCKQDEQMKLHEKRQSEVEVGRKYDTHMQERAKEKSSHGLLRNQLEDLRIKMRQSGISDVDVGDLRKKPTRRLVEEVKKCTSAINALSHVNRKATDQLASIDTRIKDLTTKREANDKELESITEMILKLDEQKDEAIERTVKQVQHNFEKIFLELVLMEGASALLSLMTADESEESSTGGYTGIRIEVCFGIGQPVVQLNQLSGGQRSLVALALIFAIQRCDPAPFYLFDEIDAALDPAYRKAVSEMIKRESEKVQFITASFKEEMLNVANKVYGIFFFNRVSRIQELSIDQGKALLRQEAVQATEPTEDPAIEI